jgi:putative aldouronate transport system substrate-binding protein
LTEDLLPLKDAMDKLYREYSTDIIRGVRPISDFDEFVTKWNAAGGTRISDYLATVLK